MKETKGITLIALVVTIIVVLILAGISIATLTGENGIINNAKEARIANEAGTVDEQVKLATTVLNLEITKNRTKYSSYDAINFINARTDGNITVEKSLVEILEEELADSRYTVTPGTTDITVTYSSPTYSKTYVITVTRKIVTLGEAAGGEEETEPEPEKDINIEFAITGTKLNTASLDSLPTIKALPTATAGTMTGEKSRYTDSQNNIAVIPARCTVSDVEGENLVNSGLVIKDYDENEFVWIPVDIDQELTLKVTSKEDITGITVLDPKGDEISVGSFSGKEYPQTSLTPTVNGEYQVRVTTENGEETEKLVVRSLYAVDVFNDWYNTDGAMQSMAEAQEFESEEEFLSDFDATSREEFLVSILGTDTEDYTTSVNKNGGFYIGRYEAGNESSTVVSKPGVQVYNNVNRNQAKTLAESSITGELHLLTSAAWDRTLDFLINTNTKTLSQIAGDSKEWGNYEDSPITGAGELADTADFGNETKANNIYDLAGNACEWVSTTTNDSSYPCMARRGQLLW